MATSPAPADRFSRSPLSKRITSSNSRSNWISDHPGATLLAALVLSIVGVLGFSRLATSPFDQVVVYTDIDPLRCTGTDATTMDNSDDERPSIPAIEPRPGMECWFEFFIENRSGSDVVVVDIVFPISGSGAGAGVQATMLDPVFDYGAGLPDGQDQPIDATFAVDDILYADSIQRYEVRLEFQKGCKPLNSFSFMSPSYPLVTLKRWGRLGEPGYSLAPLAFAGTEATNCNG